MGADRSCRLGPLQLRAKKVKPVPEPDDLTRPYWDGAAIGELRLQQCEDCRTVQHPLAQTCRGCGSSNQRWTPVQGIRTVYSYIVGYRLMMPGFDEPYIVAQLQPDEADAGQARIVANIKDCRPDSVHIGMPEEVVFERVGSVTLPQFRPT
jgi:uncharacterized protein